MFGRRALAIRTATAASPRDVSGVTAYRSSGRQMVLVVSLVSAITRASGVRGVAVPTPWRGSRYRCERPPVWPGKCQDSDMLEEGERREYAARQYESLREEMAQARQSQ